jgi:PelA/Pel-15E family pectate lyase
VSVALFFCATALHCAYANDQDATTIRWDQCLDRPADWYGSEEAKRIAENVLTYQRASGGWPKNIDMAAPLTRERRKELTLDLEDFASTIDNGATYTQMRYLARVYASTQEPRYADGFLRGLEYLLRAQYDNGGWPQFFPLIEGYYSHITFNDDAMAGVMNLLMDIAAQKPEFVDAGRRSRAAAALKKGFACILRCQVMVDGKLTAWCAQHDEKTFAPAQARTYELPSLSGKESVGIVMLLMRIDHPGQPVIASIQGAVRWFQEAHMRGIRVIRVSDPSAPGGMDKIVVGDSTAAPIWARFYEIGTNLPIFSSRDGIVHRQLSEISAERRNHYGWLDYWPEQLLREEYPRWQKTWAPKENVLLQ